MKNQINTINLKEEKMRKVNHILVLVLVLLAIGCNEGIDDITKVVSGTDASAPVVKIVYPIEGTTIKVLDVVTAINIAFEVTDDIEVASVSVKMDGTEIARYNEFLDYRRVIEEYLYENVTTGEHTLSITAVDLNEKSTTASVNFTKEPPYTQLFSGETFFMPFDGDYVELITISSASEVGNPGFAGEAKVGLNAYKAGIGNYITFPAGDLLTSEFSVSFWYKVNASPDRSGILTVGDDAADRNQGFRLFREGNGTEQRIKLNVGTGTGESWNDGDVIDVTAGEWVHIAFTISNTENILYINGQAVRTSTMGAPIDWTGCENITIGSGGETFSYWGHESDDSAMDDLRLFDHALSSTEVQAVANAAYKPVLASETFYMPFDGSNTEINSGADATVVGSPSFAGESKVGSDSYAGATGAYLKFPIDGLFTKEFSAVFWYKVNPAPDRSGILTVGDDAEDRNQGFRLFREGNAAEQRIKLNVGTGSAESWNDGGVIDVTTGQWVHVAVAVSETESKIYFDGVEILVSSLADPMDLTGCTEIVIGSGEETFNYWGHLSDSSFIDELRIFNTALTLEEIQGLID